MCHKSGQQREGAFELRVSIFFLVLGGVVICLISLVSVFGSDLDALTLNTFRCSQAFVCISGESKEQSNQSLQLLFLLL